MPTPPAKSVRGPSDPRELARCRLAATRRRRNGVKVTQCRAGRGNHNIIRDVRRDTDFHYLESFSHT